MGLGPTLLLGLVAGGTILLGLPIGRIRRPAPALRALLNAVAVGVLLFLVWDVLSAAWEPIDRALACLTTVPAVWVARSATAHCSSSVWRRAAVAGRLRAVDGRGSAPTRPCPAD